MKQVLTCFLLDLAHNKPVASTKQSRTSNETSTKSYYKLYQGT